MKFFKSLPLVGLLGASANSMFAAIDCGEGKVPSSESRMCIEPNYIEGCLSYASENQCHQCQEDYELNEYRCDFVGEAGSHPSLPGCLATNGKGECTNCANGTIVVMQGSRGSTGFANKASNTARSTMEQEIALSAGPTTH